MGNPPKKETMIVVIVGFLLIVLNSYVKVFKQNKILFSAIRLCLIPIAKSV